MFSVYFIPVHLLQSVAANLDNRSTTDTEGEDVSTPDTVEFVIFLLH